MTALHVDGVSPSIDPTAWVASGACCIGSVRLGAEVSVWYTSVLRADSDAITVSARTNIQDGCVLHADPGFPVRVGSGVSVGHRAILHGCTVEDDCLIGMGAIVLNGAVIGAGSLIAAGAVILEGTVIPPGSLVAGVPGKIRRPTTPEEQASIHENARTYLKLATKARLAASVPAASTS